MISIQLSEGKGRAMSNSMRLNTTLLKYYAYVLAEDQSKDRPESEDSCITKLKVRVEDWYGHIVKDAGEYELDGGYDKPSVDYEACKE